MNRITAIILIAAALVLVAGNPRQDQYIEWATARLVGSHHESAAVIGFMAKPSLTAATVRTNLVFCSLFQTEIYGRSALTLGILGHFFVLSPHDAR